MNRLKPSARRNFGKPPLCEPAAAPQLMTPAVAEPPLLDAQRLVQECQIQRGELEIQNEKLRRVQAELEHSRGRLAHLYNLSPVGFLTLDAEGNIREANLTAARLLGLEPNALIKKKLARFVTPPSRGAFRTHRAEVLTAGKHVCELAMRRFDGAAFSARLESVRETDGADRPAQILMSLSDVTEHCAAEQGLRESEERYRTLFHAAPLGIGITNFKGKILEVNRHLCRMAGVTLEQFMAARAVNFYADAALREKMVAQVRAGGRVENREVQLKRPDGSTLLSLVQMSQIRLGREQALMTIVQDITRQKQNERHVEGIWGLLELFATKATRKEYVEAVVRYLRDWCRCQCVGIRLTDARGGVPFIAHIGFSRQFLGREACLCPEHEDCPCYRILKEQPGVRDVEFSSIRGSYFCNNTRQSAHCLWPKPAARAAATCLQAGYLSLAQAPIRYHGRLFGTIHLADSRAGRFPAESIAFMESIAPLVGEAIHRFQTEEALQESELRFRSMFQDHEAVMLLVDPQTGTINDANPAAARFYGYPCDRLRRMKIADINPLPPKTIADRLHLTATREQNYFVFPHRLADGSLRTVEVYSSPVRVRGQLLLFSIIHDITERLQLEKRILDISQGERERVGRDLHDSLGGTLAGAALLGKVVVRKLAAAKNSDASVAQEVVDLLKKAIAETRNIARGLCPVELHEAGLADALGELAEGVKSQFGIHCDCHLDHVVIRDLTVAAHLFRIAQEAVTNAVRHGKARHIVIRLDKIEQEIRLEIRDDGRGLPARQPVNRGLGLRTMKYRGDILGGQLTVGPGPEGGTVVSCTLPSRAPVGKTSNPRKA